jgi:hypothetical protein
MYGLKVIEGEGFGAKTAMYAMLDELYEAGVAEVRHHELEVGRADLGLAGEQDRSM